VLGFSRLLLLLRKTGFSEMPSVIFPVLDGFATEGAIERTLILRSCNLDFLIGI
jgi:hypothetical protein